MKRHKYVECHKLKGLEGILVKLIKIKKDLTKLNSKNNLIP